MLERFAGLGKRLGPRRHAGRLERLIEAAGAPRAGGEPEEPGGSSEAAEARRRLGKQRDRVLAVGEEIGERRFGHWNMGQVNIARVNTALLLKYSEKPVLDPFTASGAATLALLHELVDTAQIATRGS